MSEIQCQYRSLQGTQPVCQVVAELTDRPLGECHVNDSACTFCLACGVAPQAPNTVTASMSLGVAHRLGDQPFLYRMLDRMQPHLTNNTLPPTHCILRGPETRQVPCKPCQAGRLTPVLIPVYRCPIHQECTLHNTGIMPRIKACATCEERLEKSYPLNVKPAPAAVVEQNHRAGGHRTSQPE